MRLQLEKKQSKALLYLSLAAVLSFSLCGCRQETKFPEMTEPQKIQTQLAEQQKEDISVVEEQTEAVLQKVPDEQETIPCETAGHIWSDAIYTWINHDGACTANRCCGVCGKGETETVSATCSMEAEQMMLEAKFTNPGFVTQRKPAPLADTEATFVVSNASGTPGETIAVAISLRNNPGIIAAALDVHYDTETLKLVGMTDHALMPSGLFSENYESFPYYVSWNDALGSDNLYTEGELVTLEFLILEQASVGNTEVSVSYQPGNVVNWDLEAVPFRTQAGTITIS